MGCSPCSRSMMARRLASSATGPSCARPWPSGPRWTRAALIASSAARSGPAASAMPAIPHTSAGAERPAADEQRRLQEHLEVQGGGPVGDVLEVVGELLVPGHLPREPQL